MSFKKGFTLIELLIVVSVIGILAGVTVSVIDIDATKERAKDGVRQSNMEKTIQGLESFYIIEDFYPEEDISAGSEDNNPLLGSDGTSLSTYLKSWPEDTVDRYVYEKIDDDNFVMHVQNGTNGYYKFHSSWSTIKNCTDAKIDTTCGGEEL